MGAGQYVAAIWGVLGYKPAALLSKDGFDPGTSLGEGGAWFGAMFASTLRLGQLEPSLTEEGYRAQVEQLEPLVNKAQASWELTRSALVEHGLPDPGEGSLIFVEDYS